MREQHVDPDEAVQIMEALGAVRAVGVHWDIFQLTDEAWGAAKIASQRPPPTRDLSPTVPGRRARPAIRGNVNE
jgi:L-ascorbate metabolism protein UlaG (beta-lactamase superfamily)